MLRCRYLSYYVCYYNVIYLSLGLLTAYSRVYAEYATLYED